MNDLLSEPYFGGCKEYIYIFRANINVDLIEKYAQTAKSADAWMALFIGSGDFLAIKLE
jgi:hypothetical protein